ncbi:MAG: toll/interleukin-1 receptor domain-containing protein [Candidatus Sulfotelmatobacter sp.]
MLREANLRRVNLRMADMSGADLRGADFRESQLSIVDFSHADLRGADLSSTILIATNFHRAKLDNVDLTDSIIGHTIFTATDLSTVLGLLTLRHDFPSTIDVDTLFASADVPPEPFLQGCGVPDVLITNLRSLVGAMEPIQFNSCFISYSHSDEEFAKRLHSRLRDAGVRVWFAPEDIRGGDKLYDQIDRAIQAHDRLLLVLSKHSMGSEWVTTEVRRALGTEAREHRRKLFPIRLCDMKSLRGWACFNADSGKDMAVEVREYFIPDFSNWKNHDSFESGFRRLLRDLKGTARPKKA